MKTLSRMLICALALAALAGCAAPAVNAKDEPDPAVDAARAWLALVDAGKYDESWEAAGAFFRAAVTKEQWSQALGGVRTPLGAVSSRKVSSRVEETSLPGAPDGKYVVMQLDASFAHKAKAVETVTTVLETDGHWRVVGYFIR
jgi:hypothetical protein